VGNGDDVSTMLYLNFGSGTEFLVHATFFGRFYVFQSGPSTDGTRAGRGSIVKLVRVRRSGTT